MRPLNGSDAPALRPMYSGKLPNVPPLVGTATGTVSEAVPAAVSAMVSWPRQARAVALTGTAPPQKRWRLVVDALHGSFDEQLRGFGGVGCASATAGAACDDFHQLNPLSICAHRHDCFLW